MSGFKRFISTKIGIAKRTAARVATQQTHAQRRYFYPPGPFFTPRVRPADS